VAARSGSLAPGPRRHRGEVHAGRHRRARTRQGRDRARDRRHRSRHRWR